MRRQKTVIVEAEGRDKGKTFLLTEMSAAAAEDWAARAFLMLAHSAIDFPVGIQHTGMAGIAEIAHLLGGVQFPELKPLMDELLGCVQRVEDPNRPFPRAVDSEDIEEVATRQFLRREVIDLHVNFLLGATILNLIAAASEMTTLHQDTEATPTSRRRSARSSRRRAA